MRGRRRKRGGGFGSTRLLHSGSSAGDSSDTISRLQIFAKVEATLSDRLKDTLKHMYNVKAVTEIINNEAIIIDDDQGGIKLTGTLENVTNAHHKLRQKIISEGKNKNIKEEKIADNREDVSEEKIEKQNDEASIFPPNPIAQPVKTYGRSELKATDSADSLTGRRSNRLSKKPRLSFAKIAKVGLKEEPLDFDEIDAEDVIADDFPATLSDPSDSEYKGIISRGKHHRHSPVTKKSVVIIPPPQGYPKTDKSSANEDNDFEEGEIRLVESTQDVSSSTVLVVRKSSAKDTLAAQSIGVTKSDTVIQNKTCPKVEIVQVIGVGDTAGEAGISLQGEPQTMGQILKTEAELEVSDTPRQKFRRRPGTRRKVPPAASTVCPLCGYQSRSVLGMKSHLLNYHNPTEYECDICLKKFGQKNQRNKHRSFHFDGDGSLKESAILIHIKTLERDGREENLDLELLRYVNAYREKMENKNLAPPENSIPESKDMSAVENMEQDVTQAVEGNPADAVDAPKGPVLSAEDRMLTCSFCNMKLSTEMFLNKHLQTVHGLAKKKTPSVATQLALQGKEEEKLSCPHCDFVCYRIQNFTRHLRGHEKPEFYKCDLCEYTHKNKGEVARHKRNAHAEKSHICPHCGSLHRNEVLLRTHIKLKHECGFSVMCEICGKVLKTRFSYKKHKEIYHGNPKRRPGKVLCSLCGRTLASQKTYTLHMEQCHSGADINMEEKAIAEGFIFNPHGKSSCKFCKYRNSSAREVRRHILRLHVQKTFKCSHCEAAFLRESELLKHTRVYHMELEKRKCELCNKTFLNDRYYQAHYNRIHTDNKQFECTYCKRQFYDKRAFTQHLELHKPEDERTWKYHCDQCQRRFRFKSNFDNHMLEHTGYRPYPCQICHKAFKTKNILERHLVTHSDERPHLCKICQKTFKLKKYLDIHLLSHTSDKFVCVFCGRIFVKEEALNKHICRYVAGKDGKPLRQEMLEATQVVGEEFNITQNLEEMTETTMSADKFVCTNCGECFAEESQVTEHQCSLSAKIVTLRNEAGHETFYCLTCNTEFESEEESNAHTCQILTMESGMSNEIFSGTNILENMMGDGGTTTIVVEQPGDELPLDTFEEVSIPTGENVQVLVDGEQLAAALSEAGNLQTVATSETLADILSGEVGAPVHIGQEGYEHVQFEAAEAEGVAVQETDEQSGQLMEVYMCGICEEIFQSRDDINLHLQLHADATETEDEPDQVMEAQAADAAVPVDNEMLTVAMGDTLAQGVAVEGVDQETLTIVNIKQPDVTETNM